MKYKKPVDVKLIVKLYRKPNMAHRHKSGKPNKSAIAKTVGCTPAYIYKVLAEKGVINGR